MRKTQVALVLLFAGIIVGSYYYNVSIIDLQLFILNNSIQSWCLKEPNRI